MKKNNTNLALPSTINSTTLNKARLIIIKDLILSKAYLLEILKDILCIWRQPYCSNPSICPGTDIYRGAGLTQKGSELVSEIFNSHKNDNNIQNVLLEKVIKPDILRHNLYFISSPTGNKLYPLKAQQLLMDENIITSYLNNETPKNRFFKYSWLLNITTKFFNISLKIHPVYWIRDLGTSEVFIDTGNELEETDPIITITVLNPDPYSYTY